MSARSYVDLVEHKGHRIEVVTYGTDNAAIECEDCSMVLVDFDRETDEKPREGMSAQSA